MYRITKLLQRDACSPAIEFSRPLANLQIVANAGVDGLLDCKVATEGVDSRDAKLGSKVEKTPIELPRALESTRCQCFHGEFIGSLPGGVASTGFLKFSEDAVTHLGGRCPGKGNCNDLAGIVDIGEQAQESPGKEIGLA